MTTRQRPPLPLRPRGEAASNGAPPPERSNSTAPTAMSAGDYGTVIIDDAPSQSIASEQGSPRKKPARGSRTPRLKDGRGASTPRGGGESVPSTPRSGVKVTWVHGHEQGPAEDHAPLKGRSTPRRHAHKLLQERSRTMSVLNKYRHRFRRWQKDREPPSGPCSSALRQFVEAPLFVLATTLFLLVYIFVLSVTGPQPNGENDQALLLGVSIVGLIIWGLELQLKLVGYGISLFVLDGWRCLQLVVYISLVLDVCWSQGVGLVYLRAIELMNCFDALLQVLPSSVSSLLIVAMTIRTMKSGKRMVHTVFLALSNVLPITCMLFVFVVLMALLGHSSFGTSKTDFLRNRCVVETLPRQGLHIPFMELQEGQIASGRSSLWVHSDDGRLVETVPWAQGVRKNSTALLTPLHAVAQPEAYCSNITWYGSHGCHTKNNQMCLYLPDVKPLDGFLSFDNAGVAVTVVLIVMLQQDFSPILHATVDAFGDVAVVWYLLVTVLGTYVLLNYLTALVCNSYAATHGLTLKKEDKANQDAMASGLLLDQIAFEVETPFARSLGGTMKNKPQLTDTWNDFNDEDAGDKDKEAKKKNGGTQGFVPDKDEGSANEAALALMHQWRARVRLPEWSGRFNTMFGRVWTYVRLQVGGIVRGLKFLVVFPNDIDAEEQLAMSLPTKKQESHLEAVEKRWGGGEGNIKVAWLEVVMYVLSMVHAVSLSTKTHMMKPEDALWLKNVDEGMVLMFAAVEFIRIISFGGPVNYLSRGASSQFDLFLSIVTLILYASGWNSWLQLSAFRVIKILSVILAHPWMKQARQVLLVAVGRPVDLMAAVLVLIVFFFAVSIMAWQLLGQAKFKGGTDYFEHFMSSLITIFGVSTGEEMKQLLLDGHGHIGGSAVVFIVAANIFLSKIVKSLFTSVFLSNFIVIDQDRVAYQLQFEKLRGLWGWSDEQADIEWMTMNRPHQELLDKDGVSSILYPDTAGIFHRINRPRDHQYSGSPLGVWKTFVQSFQKAAWERVRRCWARFCWHANQEQRAKTYLSALVLRGRRLNLLDGPNVRPVLFIRIRLEGLKNQIDDSYHDTHEEYALNGENCEPPHAVGEAFGVFGNRRDGESSQVNEASSITEMPSSETENGHKKLWGSKDDERRQHVTDEGGGEIMNDNTSATHGNGNMPAHSLRDARSLRKSSERAQKQKLGFESQTDGVESWNPEWGEELFVGPVVKERGGMARGMGVGEIVFELWCLRKKSKTRSVDNGVQESEVRIPDGEIFLGSTRRYLSQVSRNHSQIVVLPIKEMHQYDDDDLHDAEESDIRKMTINEKGDGATVTVRLKAIELTDGFQDQSGFCWSLVKQAGKSKTLDRIMLTAVIVCTMLSYFEQDGSFESAKEIIDLIFLALCVSELIIKISVFGAFTYRIGAGGEPYLRSGWHQLDAVIALLMLLALIMPSVHEGFSRMYAFRCIRILRPLLAISRFSGLRTATAAVSTSFLVIFAMLAVTGLVLCAWTVASLYAFNGKLDHCRGTEKLMHLSKVDCSWMEFGQDDVMRPMVWGPPEWEHFDEIRIALLTMFRALNSNGWTRVVQQVLLAQHTGHQDSTESGIVRVQTQENVLPFITLQVVGNVMITQCITSILINAIDVSRRRAFMTRAQKALEATKRLVLEARASFVREPSPNGIKQLQKVINHDLFESFTTLMIMLNILVLLSEHHDATADHVFFKEVANLVFIIWYIIEQTMKLMAFSTSYVFPVHYGEQQVAWMNIFDLLVTFVAFLEVCGLSFSNGINVLRSIRILRLLKRIPSVGTMVHAINKSSKLILGCFAMLMIITSIYSVMGSAFFAGVKHGDHLNRQSNFDTPVDALQVLSRIVGGEDWPSIMDELAISPPLCTPGAAGDCGSLWAVPYLISFYVLVQYIFLPLFLASLICTFFETVGQDTLISAADVRLFVRIWRIFDPKHTGFIAAWKIRSLLERLDAEKSVLSMNLLPKGEARINGLIALLEKSRHASISARRQDQCNDVSFLDTSMGLITALGYPWCIPGGSDKEQCSTAEKLGAKGGVLEAWARRRNAATIRDALLLNPEETPPGSCNALAGKLWRSYDGLLHVWLISAHCLPRASKHGAYCTITLFRPGESWKRKKFLSPRPGEEFEEDHEALDHEASSGHFGPVFGWSNQAAAKTVSNNSGDHEGGSLSKTCLQQMKQDRGLNFRTRTQRGSRNPEWGEHFVIPVVHTECSLELCVAEDSPGSGHKRIFGSAQVPMSSFQQQPTGVYNLPLPREDDEHESISRAEIIVRFLYKDMEQARLDVAAEAYRCLDANFVPEKESQPSNAALHPHPPETMAYYNEKAFRHNKREKLQSAVAPVNQNLEQFSANLSELSIGVRTAFDRSAHDRLEMGVQTVYSSPHKEEAEDARKSQSDSADPKIAFVSRGATQRLLTMSDDQEASGGNITGRNPALTASQALGNTGFSAQIWSYFGGKGKLDVGTVLSRRSASVQNMRATPQHYTQALSAHAQELHDSPADQTNGWPDCEDEVSRDPLPPLDEPVEDEDESLPVARLMEIGEKPTLSGHVNNFLLTPRGIYRSALYSGGKEAVPSADDGSADGSRGSKGSLANSFSVLRGIVEERRIVVEERLKGLHTKLMRYAPANTPRTRNSCPRFQGPSMPPLPLEPPLPPSPFAESRSEQIGDIQDQFAGARFMSQEMSIVSQELLNSKPIDTNVNVYVSPTRANRQEKSEGEARPGLAKEKSKSAKSKEGKKESGKWTEDKRKEGKNVSSKGAPGGGGITVSSRPEIIMSPRGSALSPRR